jgi:hypothetical protein
VTVDVDTALAMLQGGESLEKVLAALAPDEQPAVLDRCFAVRLLDEEVFRIVRSTVPKAKHVQLAAVAVHPAFEPVPGTDAYRTRREDREEHLRAWLGEERAIPGWLKKLSRKLVGHYKKPASADPLEELFHLALAEPADAIERLREVYSAVDARYDLLACRDVLDVAEERAPFAGAEFLAEFNRLERSLNTRRMWDAAHARSERFVLPKESEAVVERLVEGELRVLRIFGPPRSGKSAHLDWLIARRCVPAGFACARIDFKRIDPLLAAEEPWLLLLEIAHQLDAQLPESPLLNLLQQHGAHRERLVRRPGRGTGALGHLARETDAQRGRTAEDVRARFVEALTAPNCPKILIALDSLEAALLADDATATHHGAKALIDELARLKDAVPNSRFVLAGHSGSGATETITSHLGGERLATGGLSVEEAHSYLVDKWQLSQPEPVLRAAASAYGTAPSELERIGATLAQADGDSEPAGALSESPLSYVAQRLRKIRSPEVRWLLRYAVVGRRLDRPFVRDVLAAPLTEALRGDSTLDDPGRDPATESLGDSWRGLFAPARRTAADEPIDVDRVWRSLWRHLLLVSWADVGSDGTVVLDERVTGPLRQVLRAQPVYARLGRAAAEHFERRAEAEPARWSDWMAEALYHRLDIDPDEGVESWRRMLQRARALESRHVVRLSVALLEASAAGEPSTLDPAVIREAWLEFAWANVRIAREAPGEPRGHDGWLRAEEGLEAAQRQPTAAPFVARMALVRAALLRRDGRLPEAREILASALRRRVTPDQALRLRAEFADVLAEMGSREAIPQYRRALRLAAEVPSPAPDPAAILRHLALAYADRDRYGDAIKACDDGLARAVAGSLGHAELCLLRADLAIRSGAPTDARRFLQPAFDYGASAAHGAALTKGRAAIAGWQPADAIKILDAAMPPPRSATDAAEYDVRAAEIHEWLGVANSHLLEISEAFEHLESAAKHWAAAGFAGGAARCQARAAEFQLRGLDDVRGAGETLKRAWRADVAPASDDGCLLRLREAECADRAGRGEEARRIIDELIEGLRARGAPPRALMTAAVIGLALRATPATPQLVELLLWSVSKVQGQGARLTLVDDIWRCPTLVGIDDDLLGRLDAALRLPGAGELERLDPRDRALLRLRSGEAARACARARKASKRMAEAAALLEHDGIGVLTARRLNAAARRVPVDWETRGGSLLPAPLPEESEHSILNAAALMERAELELKAPRRGDGTRRPLASTLLEAAEKALASRPEAGQGRWLALLNELYASVTDEPTAKAHHRERARELYERLRGTPQERSGVLPAAPRLKRGTGQAAGITLRHDGQRLIVAVVEPDGRCYERAVGMESPLVEQLAAAGPATRPTYQRLARAAPRDWREWAAQAAEILLPESLRRGGTDAEPLHLRLEVGGDMALAALPWELALVHARAQGATALGTLFRAAGPDGSPGPSTPGPSEPLRVLVLRPAAEVQRDALRGPGTTSSLTIEDLYSRGGPVELAALATASLPDVESVIRSLRPHVFHVAAPFVTSVGVPTVDLSARDLTSADRQRLPATGLARLMELAGGPPPLLVLDPSGAPSASELVLQLLLRNAFAADVLQITGYLPILATGLGRYGEQDALYETLGRAFAQGGTGATLLERVRARAERHEPHAGLAHAATALFAEAPDIALPGRTQA